MFTKKKSDLERLDMALLEKSEIVNRITEHVIMLARGDKEDKLIAKHNLLNAMLEYRGMWPREVELYRKLENIEMEHDNTHVSGPGSHSISFIMSDQNQLVLAAVVIIPKHHRKAWLVLTSTGNEGLSILNSEKKVREILGPRHPSRIKNAEEL